MYQFPIVRLFSPPMNSSCESDDQQIRPVQCRQVSDIIVLSYGVLRLPHQ